MNEQEWLACNDPGELLQFHQGKASARKFRLFAVACCRRIWPYITTEQAKRAVEISEQYADGLVKRSVLISAYGATTGISHAEVAAGWAAKLGTVRAPRLAAAFAAIASLPSVGPIEPNIGRWVEPPYETHAEERWQCILLRDIFGNPFRPVTIDPVWLTWREGTIPMMAQTIYDERRFTDMPVLADALEDAGCTDADFLQHCRQPGEHVRGCWVVDLLLGKA
jgi:hypothetical protein